MLTIGSLGKKTGTKVQTVRYYEQIGLMLEPGRTEGGSGATGCGKLTLVLLSGTHASWGFPFEAIRELLGSQ